MHVTVLQPLLILAAIAIVGGVPLLGGVSTAVMIGAGTAAESSSQATVEARCASRCIRGSVSRLLAGAAPSVRHIARTGGADAPQRMWAVRRGTCALPPPQA